jgi:TonB family protein
MPLIPSRPAAYLTFLAAITSLAISPGLSSQTPPTESMPSKPADLIGMVAQRNSLEIESLKPWHLVIHVHTLETPVAAAQPASPPPAEGRNTSAATDAQPSQEEIRIEETWINSHRYKIAYQLGDHAWQVYGSDNGPMIVGEQAPDRDFWSYALDQFVRPLPDEKGRAAWLLEEKDQPVGNAKLKCISVTGFEYKGEKRSAQGATYCLDSDKPDLRIVANALSQSQTLRNEPRLFQGQFIPARIDMVRNKATVWQANLETLELAPQVDETALAAPPEAKPVVRKVTISAGVAKGLLIKGVPPSYPVVARSLGVQGTVVLQGTIGKTGKIINLRVVQGASELQGAAIDAVRQWTYKPYLLNGEPVEVDTTINVVFNLGNR